MKQRETTVLLGILAMFSFCMGHACTSVNDFWSEPIILWIAVVLPTGRCKSTFHKFLTDVLEDVQLTACTAGHEVKSVFMPHCTWDKFGDILANAGGRSFGLFDELVSFFSTMNMYSTSKMQLSDTKEYQDFLQLFTGKSKTRETITGNANYRMTQTSFTLMGFTQPQSALPIIEDAQNNAKGFTSRILWFFPKPVFCSLKDTALNPEETAKVKAFRNQLVPFLANLYGEGQQTYTIQEDNKVTTVIVDRKEFHLDQPARVAFEAVHDQWELTVCEKYPHDPLIGGLYSRGKSHVLRLAVAIQQLLLFWKSFEELSDEGSQVSDEGSEMSYEESVEAPTAETNVSCSQPTTQEQNEVAITSKENSDDCSSTTITAQAILIASSIVGTCLAQLCALNDRMHVLNHLEGKEEINETDQLTQEAGGSTNIAAFGRLYRALLLSHGPTVSLSILIRNGVFKRPCNGLSNKTLMQKVLNDLVSLGLGRTMTFRSTGNKIPVTFFKKSAVPDTPDGQKDFIHILAKCGVDLPSYTTAYNADDEDSDKHSEDFQNRKDNDASPTKRKKTE